MARIAVLNDLTLVNAIGRGISIVAQNGSESLWRLLFKNWAMLVKIWSINSGV